MCETPPKKYAFFIFQCSLLLIEWAASVQPIRAWSYLLASPSVEFYASAMSTSRSRMIQSNCGQPTRVLLVKTKSISMKVSGKTKSLSRFEFFYSSIQRHVNYAI